MAQGVLDNVNMTQSTLYNDSMADIAQSVFYDINMADTTESALYNNSVVT